MMLSSSRQLLDDEMPIEKASTPPTWRRIITLLIAALSAGWVVPMYFAISHYFGGLEDWLFSIRTSGAVYKFSPMIAADIELAFAFGWLALIIIGWTLYLRRKWLLQ